MRCIRAVKALRELEGSDLRCIALYTDVDRDAPFVRHADVATRLEPRGASAVSAYLDHDGLCETLRRVGTTNDYKLRVRHDRRDEFGQLMDGVNAMLARIEAHDRSLQVHGRELEEKVTRRTEALARAKEQAELERELEGAGTSAVERLVIHATRALSLISNELGVAVAPTLEDAVLDFAGCVVVISHDRWFLDRIATHILAFEDDGAVRWFEGNYQDYAADYRATMDDSIKILKNAEAFVEEVKKVLSKEM